MVTMGMSDLFCLICNVNLQVSSCINIFYTYLPHNGELLASFALRVLRPATSDLRSSYMCLQCYNLFQMLEQAQKAVTSIHYEILKAYATEEQKKMIKNFLSDDMNLFLPTNKIIDESSLFQAKIDIEQTINQLKNDSNVITDNKVNHITVPIKDTLLHQNLLAPNANIIIGNDVIKNNGTVDLKKNFKEEIIDSSEPDNICNNKDSNVNCIIRYMNDSCINKNIEEELLKKGTECNRQILNNVFQDRIFTKNNKIHMENSVRQEMTFCIQQCKFCNQIFKTNNELNIHLLKHNVPQLYQCQKCKETFSNISLAHNHILKIHIEDKDCINIVSEDKISQNKTEYFMNQNCIFLQNNTDICIPPKIDDNAKQITQTSESVSENVCNKTNSSNDRIVQTKTNLTAMSWKSGRISKYSLKPLKHICSVCGKKWRTSTELKTHVKSHSTIKPYMCEKCGQAYKHKHALEIHVGMHNGINPFQCNFCKKCFTQKGALMRHLPMHTGETPYQCELCGKRFIHHTSYNMHALSHTGKKSYQCHVCDLSLLSTSHLKRHMRIHTGEKPYSCTLCGKRFAERYNLFAHKKIHDLSEVTTKEVRKIQCV